MRYVGILSLPLLLAACEELPPVHPEIKRVANEVRQGVIDTADRVKTYIQTPPESKLRTLPPSYCYRVQTDIMCYREPLPGAEARLLGVQGTKEVALASVAYPKETQNVTTTSGYRRPSSRVAEIKPVFVPPAPSVASDAGAAEQPGKAGTPKSLIESQ